MTRSSKVHHESETLTLDEYLALPLEDRLKHLRGGDIDIHIFDLPTEKEWSVSLRTMSMFRLKRTAFTLTNDPSRIRQFEGLRDEALIIQYILDAKFRGMGKS